jgi:AraC-like DNA-binding protein
MIRYAYQLNDFRNWLNGFGASLRLPVKAGRIDLPSNLGKGYLYASHIAPGISFVVMDFYLREELVFLRKATSGSGLCLFFNQAQVGSAFTIRHQDNCTRDESPRQSNVFFSSTDYDLEMTWPANSSLKRAGILFHPSFIRHHVKKEIKADLQLYTDRRLRNINKEPISIDCRQYLEDIFSSDPRSPLCHLILHNRILLLCERFLQSFLTRAPLLREKTVRTKARERDIKALKDVEEILAGRLNKFPSIDSLSRSVMMSSTKLKTRFKQVYGMKLYEFYNKNRLEKARQLLKTGEFSVRQVGIKIGFSNLSNFAKAFKKEFGVLPKEMLKNK